VKRRLLGMQAQQLLHGPHIQATPTRSLTLFALDTERGGESHGRWHGALTST
jgi:hypothetical protein